MRYIAYLQFKNQHGSKPSALNLRDPTLPEALKELLVEVNMDSQFLELEFSETAVMADAVRTMDVLARLYSLGTKLSIDDYGTGYATLAYLKQIPLHRVKIDKSVVAGIANDINSEAAIRRQSKEVMS